MVEVMEMKMEMTVKATIGMVTAALQAIGSKVAAMQLTGLKAAAWKVTA